jgi:hypothetical protein
MGKSTISMEIFNSYVSLPEGTTSPQLAKKDIWVLLSFQDLGVPQRVAETFVTWPPQEPR